MDSLSNILSRKNFDEPVEVRIIKQFVQDNFKSPAEVLMQEKQIVISVRGAALAGSLRLHIHQLSKLCQTDKRLIIRIGQ